MLKKRIAGAQDEAFLHELFAHLRGFEPELFSTCPDLLQQQWQLWRRALAAYQPALVTEVVLWDATAIGELIWQERVDAIRVVNIGLLAHYRGQGIGTSLLQHLIEHADRNGKTLELAVTRHSRAQPLYQRLGFACVNDAEDGLQIQMRRELSIT